MNFHNYLVKRNGFFFVLVCLLMNLIKLLSSLKIHAIKIHFKKQTNVKKKKIYNAKIAKYFFLFSYTKRSI